MYIEWSNEKGLNFVYKYKFPPLYLTMDASSRHTFIFHTQVYRRT